MTASATSPDVTAVEVATDEDVVRLRQHVRQRAVETGFGIVDQTKLVTAASELGRNTVVYGGGGEVTVERVERGGRKGLQLAFADTGPGIDDVEQALTDGYTTGRGLGLGLGGARRLVDDFEVDTTPGTGTRVIVTKWVR